MLKSFLDEPHEIEAIHFVEGSRWCGGGVENPGATTATRPDKTGRIVETSPVTSVMLQGANSRADSMPMPPKRWPWLGWRIAARGHVPEEDIGQARGVQSGHGGPNTHTCAWPVGRSGLEACLLEPNRGRKLPSALKRRVRGWRRTTHVKGRRRQGGRASLVAVRAVKEGVALRA